MYVLPELRGREFGESNGGSPCRVRLHPRTITTTWIRLETGIHQHAATASTSDWASRMDLAVVPVHGRIRSVAATKSVFHISWAFKPLSGVASSD